jgi:hypothetical protein
MKYVIAISLLLLTGCGTSRNRIDPALEPYYAAFIEESSKHNRPLDYQRGITIGFADLSKEDVGGDGVLVGLCYHDIAEIRMDGKVWATMSEEKRLAAVFHELGHCVLGRSHTEDVWSIMYPDLKEAAASYTLQHDRALAELFR